MKIILTGASGFAGAHVLNQILEKTDFDVVCPVTFSHGGKQQRLDSLIDAKYLNRVTFVLFDLSTEILADHHVFNDADFLINFASESHVDRSISEPQSFALNNSNLMINVLEYLRSNSSCKLLHMSTDEVYGSLPTGSTNREWERIYQPSNPYSASKAAQENLAIAYFRTYNLPIIIFNATNMIGEAQNQEKFIPRIIRRISLGVDISIDTDHIGRIGSRRYVDVLDVAYAVLIVLDAIKAQKIDFFENKLPQKFHISGNKSYSNLEVAQIIAFAMKKEINFVIAPSPRLGYDLEYQLDSYKIQGLGWRQLNNIEARLGEIALWTMNNSSWLEIDYSTNPSK